MVGFSSSLSLNVGSFALDTIIQHIEENLAIYVVAVVIVAPLLYLFRKQTVPIIYHSIEFAIYCGVFHFLLGGMLRVGSWFRLETAFKNVDGSTSKEFTAFTTPLNWHFWEKELYQPHAVFYVEIAAALMILYVVVFIRPTRYKRNIYKGRVEAPKKAKKIISGDSGYTSRMRTDAQRARLQKMRNNATR